MALVDIERRAAVATVTIDNPPVNVLTRSVRAGLLDAFAAIEADSTIESIVLRGAGRTFVAGADIRELERGPEAPHTPQVVAAVEGSRKPVVAALHGTALGGGLEIALACHRRVAAADAAVGFPEIRLGLIPGASGTQRLPRLVGIETALELMMSGESIPASRALELGIVDIVVDRSVLLDAAVEQAAALAKGGPLSRIRDLPPPELTPSTLKPFRERIARRLHGQLAPQALLRSVENASRLPFDEAVQAERELFLRCLASDESKAMRHAFFAEREAIKVAVGLGSAMKRPIERAAVIGAGTMGAGIAYCLLVSGLEVILQDVSAEQLVKGEAAIRGFANAAVARGRVTPQARDALAARLATTDDLGPVANVDLVIEAVFENMALKRAVFADLDTICTEDTLLASNTSTLDIDAIAAATGRPEDVLGLHFFSPAPLMRLVEIVRGGRTSPDAIAAGALLAKRLGKVGVVVGNGFGFVGNRMFHSYGREAQRLLLEGAAPEQIDEVLQDWGMAMGPHAVGDMAGLDVGYKIRRERDARDEDPSFFRIADALAESGRYGQKTGRGMYRYTPGVRQPLPDPDVAEIIAREAARLGIECREIGSQEIVERCLYAMIVEGARLLEEGIARSAGDIDVIWLNGYGFPRYRGGPMFYADRVGLANVYEAVCAYRERFGPRYWQPPGLIENLVRHDCGFGDL